MKPHIDSITVASNTASDITPQPGNPEDQLPTLVEVFQRLQPELVLMADHHLRGVTCAEDVITEAFFLILSQVRRPRPVHATDHWLFDRVEALVKYHARIMRVR